MDKRMVLMNPFRPGAGHMPPYLAGREPEQAEFERLLQQTTVLQNLVLTGLRGVGKTVLLDTFKPLAIKAGWHWVGTDMSESASLSEENIAKRLLADLSTLTSSITIAVGKQRVIGFGERDSSEVKRLDYLLLEKVYQQTPGLVSDKLKAALELAWSYLKDQKPSPRGIVFAYDEAQNLADHASKNEFPLSLLLDVFQSLQRKELPVMLALTGLPTLFPKLVEARTFAERMFRVVFLDRLDEKASRDAILKPIQQSGSSIILDEKSVKNIVRTSGGYPYFIQFICREVFDTYIQAGGAGRKNVPLDSILRKLDSDFFAGRWARATDRQRELLSVIAQLENHDKEFSVQEIVEQSRATLRKPFGSSHVNQMLASLAEAGLIYKNRHGRYSFAVPLLGEFIRRTMQVKTVIDGTI